MIQKENVSLPFSQGLNSKVDSNQLPLGQFIALDNASFDKAGALTKRYGFPRIANYGSSAYLGSYKNSLFTMDYNLNAQIGDSWSVVDELANITLSTQPILRSTVSQVYCDMDIIGNIVCTVSKDSTGAYAYYINDLDSGRILKSATITSSNTPKVRALGNYFIILYTTANTLYALPIGVDLTVQTAITLTIDFSTCFDAVISNNNLCVAFNNNSTTAISIVSLTPYLTSGLATIISGLAASNLFITTDSSNNDIYVAFINSTDIKCFAIDSGFVTLFSNTTVTFPALASGGSISNVSAIAINGQCYVLREENLNTLLYTISGTNYYNHQVRYNTITRAGVPDGITSNYPGFQLASRPFMVNGAVNSLMIFNSLYQPTYFQMELDCNIKSKLASGNGYAAFAAMTPNIYQSGDDTYIPYLITTDEQPVSKDPSSTNNLGISSKVGINLAKLTVQSAHNLLEVAQTAFIPSAMSDMYDNKSLVEHGFSIYPEILSAVDGGSGGHINADTYYYQAVYQWTDNQGIVHRSAPSLPVQIIQGSSNRKQTVTVRTLTATWKTDVVIEIYRWSLTNQIYYLAGTVANSRTTQSVTFTDNIANAVTSGGVTGIVGNLILYTTGGVLENTQAPPTKICAVYKSRVWVVNAEDTNQLWYSKQIIENTPVEFSAYQTLYVPPTVGAEKFTGGVTALSTLDDKLIIFKKNSIDFIYGNGPDITGSNNDFSDAIHITGTVGCTNSNSLITIPSGLMFQSDKGIWLLGRNLVTQYIGAPVEAYNNQSVVNVVAVPGTNQVRFLLDDGLFLIYDYFFNQWGTYSNIQAVDSIIHNNKHTIIRSNGVILQETAGSYLDDSSPVLMSFKTAWASLAGLQGFERAYFFYLLGQYFSPHKLQMNIAYDYESYPRQQVIFSPDNFRTYDTLYGDAADWGGSNLEQMRVFLETQKCQSFQIELKEIYDPSYGIAAGQGLKLSGLNLVVGRKKGYAKFSPSKSIG